jgi:hypothetical protein
MYHILTTKIICNDNFLKYCSESFEVTTPTVYRYLNFYLIKEYPSILLPGLVLRICQEIKGKKNELLK